MARRLHWRRGALAVTGLLAAGALVLAIERASGPWAWAAAVAMAVVLGLAWIELADLRATFRAHKLAMRGAHDGLWWWNPVTKRLWVGDRLLEILGYSDNFIADTHVWLHLVHPDDRGGYNRGVAQHLKGETPHFYHEYRVRAKDGSYRWIASRGEAVRNHRGRAVLMAGSVTDITARRQTEERIRTLAYHDQLTGLANRALLFDRLNLAIERVRRRGQGRIAVLFIDIDRFKDVNDVHGHEVGDLLLVELARRLRANVRASDTLVRQGGDEFIIVLPEITDSAGAAPVLDKVLQAVHKPIHVNGIELCMSASIGVSVFPDDAQDVPTLLRNADTAMYEAKHAGGNLARFYTHAMNDAVRERVNIEAGLRQAVARGELALHFQPKMRLGDSSLMGCEALLRWRDAEGRQIPPDRFIPVAESCGLIVPIGQWVADAALDQMLAWRSAGLKVPRVAINVSAIQLAQPGFAPLLLDALARRGLPNSLLELEVTESVFLHPEGAALEALRMLRSRGVRLALDDFGTGYSSLAYLGVQAFDTLKIDRSFVATADAPGQARSAAILRAMVAMATAFGMDVVAEGIERDAQRDALWRLGCESGQGYLFGAPMPAADFEARCLSARPPSGASLRVVKG
ncbi:EAL domain-containing protein [Nitrogeniibacter mangrovi]|uniref:EAL domain-containing protein n=1 Tax=Nitrogeniibacter mangrovi TaxID=2016596 RepID=A0A6C1B172_9RHOO|nr:GGDEF domain-containing phosphodiesterase [Nitrogeniibacter mangrovi]QID16655.1 EAL domain-containing protein [Nitrogeniibacter mangrovi]